MDQCGAPIRVHLDTDFRGDPDDACALAMLLGWPGVEIVGITTSLDRLGLRAAYAIHLLNIVGRGHIPVAAGAALSMTTLAPADPVIRDERHWPLDTLARPSPPGAAVDLLMTSIDAGATVVSIGPYTNLAQLEVMRSGTLTRASVVLMGGWVDPPGRDLPAWGPEMDFNVQSDTRAAEIVTASAGELTLATLSATFGATLRAVDLPRLRASGPMGALLASQSQAFGLDNGMAKLGRSHAGLPDDLVNVQWDPVTCAVAVGWSGVTIEVMRLAPTTRGGVLRFERDERGRPVRVVTVVNGESFRQVWIAAIEAAQH